MSRTLSGLFLVGAGNWPRQRKRTNREIPGQIRNSRKNRERTKKGTKKEGQVQIGKPPPFETDAAFLRTVGSFLLTVEFSYLQLTILAFLLTVGACLLTILACLPTVGAFLLTVGKVRLIRALRDCKQRSLTVSKKSSNCKQRSFPRLNPPPLLPTVGTKIRNIRGTFVLQLLLVGISAPKKKI